MAAPEQLYAVLVALREDTLLLPNSAIAEVVGAEGLQARTNAPAWLAGQLPWSGRDVPVIRFEVLNGAPAGGDDRRARIVIVNAPGSHAELSAIGIWSQGYPHLVTLNRTAVQPAKLRDTDRADLLLSRVRIASTQALILDLDTVEADLVRAGLAQGRAATA